MDTENQSSEKNVTNSGYDIIIIGAGPAGMFAAYELAAIHSLKILIVDMGRDIEKRLCQMKNSYLLHALHSVRHYVRCRRLWDFFGWNSEPEA